MRRPTKLGILIAERTFLFKRPGKRSTTVQVRFGRPIRLQRGPWLCPLQVTGLGPSRVTGIAGEDSLQSLVLALEFVTLTLPAMARHRGGQVDWLDETEDPVFAKTFMLDAYTRAAGRLAMGIKAAIPFIKAGTTDNKPHSRRIVRRLERLAKTWGLVFKRPA